MDVDEADGGAEVGAGELDGTLDQRVEAEEAAHEPHGHAGALVAADGAGGDELEGGGLGEVGDEEVRECFGVGFGVDTGAGAGEWNDGEGGGAVCWNEPGGDVELVVDCGGSG
jgi:hypothetical protein